MTHVRVQMFGGSSRKTVDMHDVIETYRCSNLQPRLRPGEEQTCKLETSVCWSHATEAPKRDAQKMLEARERGNAERLIVQLRFHVTRVRVATRVRVQIFGASFRKTVNLYDGNIQVPQAAAAPTARRRRYLQARDLKTA